MGNCFQGKEGGAGKKDNSNPNEFDYLYKLVLVGDAMVGKSSLVCGRVIFLI